MTSGDGLTVGAQIVEPMRFHGTASGEERERAIVDALERVEMVSPSAIRATRPTSRSCKGRRPTPPTCRRAAGSTRAVRWRKIVARSRTPRCMQPAARTPRRTTPPASSS